MDPYLWPLYGMHAENCSQINSQNYNINLFIYFACTFIPHPMFVSVRTMKPFQRLLNVFYYKIIFYRLQSERESGGNINLKTCSSGRVKCVCKYVYVYKIGAMAQLNLLLCNFYYCTASPKSISVYRIVYMFYVSTST